MTVKEVKLGIVTTDEYKERALRQLQDGHNELVPLVNKLQKDLGLVQRQKSTTTVVTGDGGGSTVGPKGDTGATGPAGPQGPQGPAGTGSGSGEVEFHVKDYFDSSISTDWGGAFNAAIADCFGPGDPLVGRRLAKGPIIIPAGHLPIRTLVSVKGVFGLSMRGAGRYSTSLEPDGIESGLDLVGVTYSQFRDFSIRGSGSVENGIYSYHDAAQAISFPTTNSFYNVDVMELDFVTGYRIGGPVNGDQCDKHAFFDCKVQGRWTWGNPFDRGVNGYVFGKEGGSAGNNLVHNIFGLNVANVAFAVQIGGSCVNVYGGSTEQTHSVIYDNGGPIEPCGFYGIRSEGSRYFYLSLPGTTWMRMCTMQDCTMHGGKLESNEFMQLGAGGSYNIKNFTLQGDDPTFTSPIIRVLGVSPTSIHIDGIGLCNADVSALANWLSISSPSTVSVFAKGVMSLTNSDGITQMVPLIIVTAGVAPGTAIVTS